MRKLARLIRVIGLLLICILGGAGYGVYSWISKGTAPTPTGKGFFVRYSEPTPSEKVLQDLKERGVVRDVEAYKLFARFRKAPERVSAGTYEFAPGMAPSTVFAAMRKPIRRMVRLPETNWAKRTANLLEKKYQVGTAAEYMALVQRPSEFASLVSFRLPARSLEGYLYPDTYDLPPLMTAKEVIQRQLKAFESKVWEGLDQPKNLDQILIIASLVELEAGTDEDRYMISGVIQNRIAKGMRLQIDATILYGMQEWRRLTFADYRSQRNPYNTYLIDGLPPGPICSPSLASIKAAMNPAKHNYVYYVAMPDGRSIFASTYDGHKENIKRRLKALEATQ